MKKIYYDKKSTSANTDYLGLSASDQDSIMNTILSLNAYMQELSISADKDVKDFTKWFTKPSRNLPYNKHLRKHNSPQSMLAGILNNMLYGEQRDFSLSQLEHIQNIINTSIDIIEELNTLKNINLQKHSVYEKILIMENLWQTE